MRFRPFAFTAVTPGGSFAVGGPARNEASKDERSGEALSSVACPGWASPSPGGPGPAHDPPRPILPPLPLLLLRNCFLFGHLSCWSRSPFPPFFQSPLKFIGFSGGLAVLLQVGNRDQSIHYSDIDGCGSRHVVAVTRTSKRGSPLFSE